ncbi:MAG: biopolymer transporter ExbD [Pseudomonadota bacterium]
MRFTEPQSPSRRALAILPMINLAFLLLMFFLLTATIAPVPRVDLALSGAAATSAAAAPDALFIAADGRVFYAGLEGSVVFDAIAARDQAAPLEIRADAALDARQLAGILPRLAALGVSEVTLVAVAQ